MTCRPILLCLSLLLLPQLTFAQDWSEEGEYRVDWGGYLFGFRGGIGGANQDWSGLETEIVPVFFGDLFLETVPAQGRFSFYGSLGHHTRGSRISRQRAFTFGGNRVTLPSDRFEFYNISLGVGAKQVFSYSRLADLYYVLGLRAEYTYDTNLDEYDQVGATQGINFRANYPVESYEFINRLTYGVTAGAGASFPLSSAVGGFVELTAQPDLSFQYNQGPIQNIIDPFGGGVRTIPERMIRNFTVELSVGLRFLRKWRYVD